MNKTERQTIGITKWQQARGRGGLKFPTGFGKTTTALTIVQKMLVKEPNLKVIVLVHSTSLKLQWQDKIKQLELQQHVKVHTIQKLQRVENSRLLVFNYHLLIIDEVDEFYSDNRSNSWNGKWIRYKYFLWLSATPETKDNRETALFAIAPIVDEITRDEALTNKWIEEFKEFNLAVEFNAKEKEMYKNFSNEITHLLSKFAGDFSVATKCLGYIENNKHISGITASTNLAKKMGWTEAIQNIATKPKQLEMSTNQYDTCIAVNENWHPYKVIGFASRLIKMTRERKQLCYSAENKIKVIEEIIESQSKKTIIFNEITSICDTIYNRLKQTYNCGVYHSNVKSRPLYSDDNNKPTLRKTGCYVLLKNTSKNFNVPKTYSGALINKMTLDAFSKNEFSILVAGKGLDKGLDIPDITLAILASYTSTKTQYIQRLGRITRIDQINPEPVMLVNLYVPNTIEESILRYNADGDWITDVEDINKDYVPPFKLMF